MIFLLAAIVLIGNQVVSQRFDLQTERNDVAYVRLKEAIVHQFKNASPGHFEQFIPAMEAVTGTGEKIIALTFDACGGKNGNGYDSALIDYLKVERIPATLFLSGTWIDANIKIVKTLVADTLFEIENHGLYHRPCSEKGESMYGIKGTDNVGQMIDEIELNSLKIKDLTGRKPQFYRSATTFADEECAKIAYELNERIVSYNVLSGDAVLGVSAETIQVNYRQRIKKWIPGDYAYEPS